MKLTTKQYAVALYQKLEAVKPSEHAEVFAQFVSLLAGQNRLSLLPQITEQLKRHCRAEQGVAYVNLTTAKPVSSAHLKKLKKILEDELEVSIELKSHTDEKIIGGAVVQLNDTVINGSIAYSLNQLKATLAASA